MSPRRTLTLVLGPVVALAVLSMTLRRIVDLYRNVEQQKLSMQLASVRHSLSEADRDVISSTKRIAAAPELSRSLAENDPFRWLCSERLWLMRRKARISRDRQCATWDQVQLFCGIPQIATNFPNRAIRLVA